MIHFSLFLAILHEYAEQQTWEPHTLGTRTRPCLSLTNALKHRLQRVRTRVNGVRNNETNMCFGRVHKDITRAEVNNTVLPLGLPSP